MAKTAKEPEEADCWSVFQLTSFIKNLLESEEALSAIWVKGEISNYKRASSGHAYFDLKDAQSQIRCVMFKRAGDRLLFEPDNGRQVMLFGRVAVYEKSGQYQMVVEEIRAEGQGELYAAFLKLKEKLAAEGLFDESRKRALPFLPRLIGIVTSPQAAALRDLIAILGKRNDSARIIISPALVQGKEAPASLIEAIRRLNRIDGVDVIIIGRGGGSFEDLNCFNDEALAREIASSKIPVISAVGHETDFTIADFVADLRAPTPSGAAQMVIPDKLELLRQMDELRARLKKGLIGRLNDAKRELAHILSRRIFKYPFELLGKRQQEMDFINRRLEGAMERFVRVQREKLSSFSPVKLGASVLRCLGVREANLTALGGKLDALSPLKVLNRGYSLCLRGGDGGIVRSVRDTAPGEDLEVLLADGRIYARTTAVMEEAVSADR